MISQDRYINIITQNIASNNLPSNELILRIITANPNLQPNAVIEFTDATTVGDYFGLESEEYQRAVVYFSFTSKSGRRPSKISFYRWQKEKVGVSIFGDNSPKDLTKLAGHANPYIPIAALDDKNVKTPLDVVEFPELSTTPPTSLEEVASILQKNIAAYTKDVPNLTVTYHKFTQQFILKSDYSDKNVGLKLIIDQEAQHAGYNLAPFLGWGTLNCVYGAGGAGKTIVDAVKDSENLSNNFGSFVIAGEDLSVEQIGQVAAWNAGKNNLYMYLVSVTQSNFETIYQAVKTNGGTALSLRSILYPNDYIEMLPGMILASTDYSQAGAVKNYMYYQSNQFNASVFEDQMANKLDANCINYYGQTQQAGQKLAFYQRGVLCGGKGDVTDMTTYANELWLKTDIKANIFNLLINREALNANPEGVSILQAIIQKSIDQAKNNGTIINGVTLSDDEKAIINGITNNNNSAINQIQNSGYLLNVQIKDKVNDNNQKIEKCAVYTLIYTKADQIRTVQGTHDLV